MTAAVKDTTTARNLPARDESHSLWCVDLLRGVFAVMVVAGHSYGLVISLRPAETWRPLLLDRTSHGLIWVAGFFVLSGYCIALSSSRSSSPSPHYFVRARISRIVPLYAIGLGIAIATEGVMWVWGHRPDFWPVHLSTLAFQVVLLQGILGRFGSYDPSWSITHELFAYGIWSFLMLLPLRSAARIGLTGSLVACLALGSVFALTRTPSAYTAFSLPYFITFWFLGVLGFVWSETYLRLPQTLRFASFASLLVALSAMLFAVRVPETLAAPFAGIATIILILETRSLRVPRTLAAVSRWCGDASYPLYLLHGPLIVLLGAEFGQAGGSAVPWASWATCVLVSLVIGGAAGVPLERMFATARARYLLSLKRQKGSREGGS